MDLKFRSELLGRSVLFVGYRAAAARAEAAALAREGYQPLEGAVPAAYAGEAAGEDPAAEEVAELALDEDAAFGAAGLIAAGTHGDRTSEGRAGLGLRSGAALPVRTRRAAERPAATPCFTTSGRSRGLGRPTPRLVC